MADEGYQVVFRGELVGDRPAEKVKQQLAALFKMPPAKIEPLFSGKPVVVKRGLDEATARKFEAAFRKAGAVCELRAPGGDAQATPQPSSAGGKKRAAAPAGTGQSAPAAARPRNSTAAAGDPNQTQLDLEIPESLEGLEVDESDAPLSPGERKPPPDIDISELDLAEQGGNLTEPRKQPPADIDTSGLSIDESDS